MKGHCVWIVCKLTSKRQPFCRNNNDNGNEQQTIIMQTTVLSRNNLELEKVTFFAALMFQVIIIDKKRPVCTLLYQNDSKNIKKSTWQKKVKQKI